MEMSKGTNMTRRVEPLGQVMCHLAQPRHLGKGYYWFGFLNIRDQVAITTSKTAHRKHCNVSAYCRRQLKSRSEKINLRCREINQRMC